VSAGGVGAGLAHRHGLVQGLARVVGAIRWDEVDRAERKAWLEQVDADFGSGTDAHFVAVRAITELAATDADAITEFLKTRFLSDPSVELLALISDTVPALPKWARTVGWSLLSEDLARVRSDAADGKYGIGTLDVCDLAAALLLQDPRNRDGWAELIAFLLDPATSAGSKQRAFDRLARSSRPIPRAARDDLRHGLGSVEAATLDLEAPPEGFVAAKLRLASRIGGVDRNTMLTQLLALAGSSAAYARIEAAITLPYTRRRLAPHLVITIALMLARDASPDVRAAAAESLAQLQRIGDVAIRTVVREQLVEFLGDPGTAVPARTLLGLRQFVRSGGTIDDEIGELVGRLSRHHMSQSVRRMASAVAYARGRAR
jgi:hypothetical protein